jgi:dolichol-phosphate mannosyltransferase
MILVFLPAYNEEVALPRLTKKFDEELRAAGEEYKIVVLDDGSKDNTASVAEELAKHYPVVLLRHRVNLGLGQTMVDGLQACVNVARDEDYIVTLDCDDTHEPKYLRAALDKARQGGFDVVILSRYTEGGGQEGLSPVKKALSGGAGLFLKAFFPIRGVKEYSCNYRVYRASILKKAFRVFGPDFVKLQNMGFVVTPEILVKMRMLGARITESPFVLRYDQKPGKSTNRPLRTIRGYFALVWNYWLRR